MSELHRQHKEHVARRSRLFPLPPMAPAVIAMPKPDPDPQQLPIPSWKVRARPAAVADEIQLPTCPPVRVIIKTVSYEYNISVIDIMSARRMADMVKPRQVAMYLAKTLTTRSLPEIGRSFGGRDHTTVLHAVRKIERLLPIDPELAVTVAYLEAQLSQ